MAELPRLAVYNGRKKTRSIEALLAVRGDVPCHQKSGRTREKNAHKRSDLNRGTPILFGLPERVLHCAAWELAEHGH